MDSFAHTAPVLDFIINFQRLGVLVTIALAAKWILISYTAIYAILMIAEFQIHRKESEGVMLGAPTLRVGAVVWIFNFAILYFVFVVWPWTAKTETCVSNGGFVFACSATVPALLALCIVIATGIDLFWAAAVLRRQPMTRLFSVFD